MFSVWTSGLVDKWKWLTHYYDILVKVDIFMVRLSYLGTDDVDLKNDARFVISDPKTP